MTCVLSCVQGSASWPGRSCREEHRTSSVQQEQSSTPSVSASSQAGGTIFSSVSGNATGCTLYTLKFPSEHQLRDP